MKIKELKAAASKIKHCGDYGYLYWNKKTATVFWTAGDADGEAPCSTLDEIKIILGSVSGVKNVEIEAEYGPDEENGWKSLGQFGKEVSL